MGNREDLLAGAKRCLLERGWARTTVRDIAEAAGGVSHAAIGYHFGSRETLLVEAFVQAMEEWGAEIDRALGAYAGPGATPAQRYEALWTEMIRSFTTHRKLWIASAEAFVQAEHSPELRDRLAAGQREGRRGTASALAGVDEDAVPERTVRTLGSAHLALMNGVMMQWLLDPDHAPTGPEVVEGLRALIGSVAPDAPAPA
ncbi:TetR/AcrR family transcriptional regulator [Streptosporangium longisporum]|uniref:TetR/AcrR family transcriptional regulator n=1 Tax=Streptosporangium longisporum TaxID=46187 RepID=A0ABN3Y8Q2_9ACTN